MPARTLAPTLRRESCRQPRPPHPRTDVARAVRRLAHDQRYCVECGERRGASRFPAGQPAAEASPRRARAARAPRGQRISSGTTLVAGVGVLLLAIGLGVLIGRLGHNNAPAQKQAPAEVVTVQGGAGADPQPGRHHGLHHPGPHRHPRGHHAAPKGLTGKLKRPRSRPPRRPRRSSKRPTRPPARSSATPTTLLRRRKRSVAPVRADRPDARAASSPETSSGQ